MNELYNSFKDSALQRIEDFCTNLLQPDHPDEEYLYKMMNYSFLSGGKRVRPFLTYLISSLFEGNEQVALYFGSALEMVHTYSLIHDDLPSMDNDDYRRGKESSHKVFGEANAILAGDALLTDAFSILTSAPATPTQITSAVHVLSRCAGSHGMVKGQVLDLQYEGQELTKEDYLNMVTQKTSKLIIAAVKLGLISANITDDKILEDFIKYSKILGLVFQITDDYLDSKENASSDLEKDKCTIFKFFDEKQIQDKLEVAIQKANLIIAPYDTDGLLKEFSLSIVNRTK